MRPIFTNYIIAHEFEYDHMLNMLMQGTVEDVMETRKLPRFAAEDLVMVDLVRYAVTIVANRLWVAHIYRFLEQAREKE